MFGFRVLKWTSRTETFDFFCLKRVVSEVLISYGGFSGKTWFDGSCFWTCLKASPRTRARYLRGVGN